MKLTIDLSNPQDVTNAIAMLKSLTQADPFRVAADDVTPQIYRFLNTGELILEGDEKQMLSGEWKPTCSVGKFYDFPERHTLHRRKISKQ